MSNLKKFPKGLSEISYSQEWEDGQPKNLMLFAVVSPVWRYKKRWSSGTTSIDFPLVGFNPGYLGMRKGKRADVLVRMGDRQNHSHFLVFS